MRNRAGASITDDDLELHIWGSSTESVATFAEHPSSIESELDHAYNSDELDNEELDA